MSAAYSRVKSLVSSFCRKVNMPNYADFVFNLIIYLHFLKSFLPVRNRLLEAQTITAIFYHVPPGSTDEVFGPEQYNSD